ncbi:hypothetical protein ACQR50_01850 [Sphingomonas sp. Xoc002]|uniref:hypothetical protein n=1 Tax=Sphingomonas sp. Xoc002 TaxID=2837624 RepID=UPI003D16CE04
MLLLLAALQISSVPPETAPKEKIVCKTIHETGSFLKKRKTCLTRQQWQRTAEVNQGAARSIVSANMGVPEGNGTSLTGQ